MAITDERKNTMRRIQRLTYWFTEEYVKELENKKKEDAAVKEMNENSDTNEIKCVVLTAEHNAEVMMECIKECICAVNLLANEDEEVEDWMLAGINAMLEKVNESRCIPFDLPTSICGLLCTHIRK